MGKCRHLSHLSQNSITKCKISINVIKLLQAQVARHMAVFWLIIQALLLFDLVFDIHEYMIDEADYRDKQGLFSTHIYVLYIFFCIVGLVSSIVGKLSV